MADCVKAMAARQPESLFAVTGNHIKNYYVMRHPGPSEKASVPLVLFGPQVLQGKQLPANVAGTHLDLISTLVELSASKVFSYHALGNDLLTLKQRFAGVAQLRVITSNILYFLEPSSMLTHPLQRGAKRVNPSWQEGEVRTLHDTLHGISWWRIKEGPLLQSD